MLAACGGSAEYAREPVAGPPLPAAPPSATAPARDVSLPPEAGAATGPRGTAGAGEAGALDEVGYSSWYGEELNGNRTASGTIFDPGAITAAHRTLPLSSYAEVTALDTGRTILVLVNDRGPGRADRIVDLSRGAAQLLGLDRTPGAPVRVRSVVASREDVAALTAGRTASPRLDAPPQVLTALRKQLRPVTAAVAPAAPHPPRSHKTPPSAASVTTGRFLVQVAAYSNGSRARALAKALGGRVDSADGVHRVRLGPFLDTASAQRARDGAIGRGYGDATILTQF